jgi:hypothetical protein
MVNNYTNINKTNNHLSPYSLSTKNGGQRHMMLKIQVIAGDRYKNGTRLNYFKFYLLYSVCLRKEVPIRKKKFWHDWVFFYSVTTQVIGYFWGIYQYCGKTNCLQLQLSYTHVPIWQAETEYNVPLTVHLYLKGYICSIFSHNVN